MKLTDAISVAVRICMKAALDETNGNVTEAAVRIGVDRTHFYALAKKHAVPMAKRRRPVSAVQELANWRRA